MAAQTDTYANLLALIESRFGGSFGSTEQGRVRNLVNSRARQIYRESDFWENMLVIGEERAVDDSTSGYTVVPYTGTVFDTTEDVTDANPYSGAVDTFMRVHEKNPWDQISVNEIRVQGAASGARLVGHSIGYGLGTTVTACTTPASNTVRVTITGTTMDVYVGGTIKLEGFDTDVHDINGKQTVTAVTGYTDGDTIVDFTLANAFNSWSMAGDEKIYVPSVFCSYKKRLTSTYGDGTTSGDTTVIPGEWVDPIALGVMADMLAADEKYEASMAWEGRYKQSLQLALEKLDRSHAIQTVGSQFADHATEQSRNF